MSDTGTLRDRPAFAHRYPSDPELDALVARFARGDFRHVRRQAAALADRTDDAAIREAARDLRHRTEPSRFALYLLVLGVGLLIALVAIHRAHGLP